MLVVHFGRSKDDGLPEGATGAAMIVFSPAKTEDLAVSDAARLLRDAGLQPLEVESYGTCAERETAGHEFSEREIELIVEAENEGAVIIVDKQVFFDDDDGVRH